MRLVQTIHNLAYQGRFRAENWHLLNLDARYFTRETLEFYGDINFLKAGLVFADVLTTVSPRYAREIQTPELGEGLDGVLRARAGRLRGIVNGIDYRVWNPAADPALPARYDTGDLGGKARCKADLQATLGLQADAAAPLLAVVSRLAWQKGIDVVARRVPRCSSSSPPPSSWCSEAAIRTSSAACALLAEQFPGRVAVRTGMDEALAHRIVAGADLFLMPSRYEPCGLSQLYSLRYGTVPVVHATGGLDDTVAELDPATGEGTGFKFAPDSPEALRDAVQRALAVRRDPAAWTRLQERGMREDFSWERSARAYRNLYGALLAAPESG